MPREATKLHTIEASPEARLREQFKREDELLTELAIVRGVQRQTRRDYAEAHGLLILPSMTKLREVLM